MMASLLERLDEAMEFDPVYVGTALVDLVAAALGHLLITPAQPTGLERTRSDAQASITTHANDPSLTPPAIAAAIGVSVRYLHLAFDGSGSTVSSHLRRCRTDLVVAALLRATVLPQRDALAALCGFDSADRLARAVRQRFGVPVRTLHESLHD